MDPHTAIGLVDEDPSRIEDETREFGCDPSGGYNSVSLSYKENPTLEHYVELRRGNPEAEIEVSVVGGMDQLFFMEPELLKYGFDPRLVASVLDAAPEAISELSLQIMERLIEARRLAKDGGTHLARRGLAIPDKLVNWLICCMVDALSWTDTLHMPRELIVLVRERLGGPDQEYVRASRAHQMRRDAISIGARLKAMGAEPSYRRIAKILRVAPTTVMRWFPEGEFSSEIGTWDGLFDENGKFINFMSSALHSK